MIAEGVESETSMLALRKHGCDEVQGYHLTRPLPGNEIARWIRARGGGPGMNSAGDSEDLIV